METHEPDGRQRRLLRTLPAQREPACFPAPFEGRGPRAAAHRERGVLHLFLAQIFRRENPRRGQRRQGRGPRGRGPDDYRRFRDLRCDPDRAGNRKGFRVPGDGGGYHRVFLPVAGTWGEAAPASLSQAELFQEHEEDERHDDHGREHEDDDHGLRLHARHEAHES